MFLKYKPSDILKKFIRCYWIHKGTSKLNIIPDGCFDIVIDLKNNQQNKVLLTGIWEQKIEVESNYNNYSVGISFFPNSLDIFFNCTISDIVNSTKELTIQQLKKSLHINIKYIFTSKEPEEIISFFDVYFIEIYNNYYSNNTSIFDIANDIKVCELSNINNISERQLNRLYKNTLGISPKTYINILKFIKSKSLLDKYTYSSTNLSEIALKSGYYDQSHFTREFKKYSGLSPKKYLYTKKNNL